MAIKKSELYSTIWDSCNELRGGMDSSQYKDYILVLLFVKYVSDKYGNDPTAMIVIPEGGSFKDMQALKGNKDIGNKMNIIIGELAKANDLKGVIDVADFNDDDKLGSGAEMIEKLTKLIAIFENPALDFSKNRAGGDDILGDAFEYLMKNFATESGKSKGQFYTPSEVSRVIAKILGIRNATNQTTFYDPTCGSGSLLLKALDEADGKGTIYGQEKDVTTAALARMNMILHGQTANEIHRGQSTLSNPEFRAENGALKTFDFVVANPPFSSKNWATGFNPQEDIFGRFEKDDIESAKTGKAYYKTPPDKNGDYAFLLHILKSLKNTGKGACILPHGVLFRGNAEAEIRKSLIQRGYIKGIIGLPANLFYGTGIPACIIVLDKENAQERKHIFMVDASKGFLKDGNKNRLREQDIHKIVDVFNKQTEIAKFSRLVSLDEISDPKNDYNLNIPRYIDSQETEDRQDIEAHLLGDLPNADIDALAEYWAVYPNLKADLFAPSKREQYSQLKIHKDEIKQTIFNHPQFVQFSQEMDDLFADWQARNAQILHALNIGFKPQQLINQLSEDILHTYARKDLMDKYAVYQHLMQYWHDTMQDDCYLIAVDGWKAEPYRILIKNKKGADVDKGWECDLVPKALLIDAYFADDKKKIETLEAQKEAIATQLAELEEEHNSEDGYFADFDKVNKASVQQRLKAINTPKIKADNVEEIQILSVYLSLVDKQAELNKNIKIAATTLDDNALGRYKSLTETEIKDLVVNHKWLNSIARSVKTEMERISQRLTSRIKELAERYETALPIQTATVAQLESKVIAALESMGFAWTI
jgi:type I restriction enzyme M protein